MNLTVLDNATYHNTTATDSLYPKVKHKKEDTQKWLREKNIQIEEDALKVRLVINSLKLFFVPYWELAINANKLLTNILKLSLTELFCRF